MRRARRAADRGGVLTFLTESLEEGSVLMEGNYALVTIAVAHEDDSFGCYGNVGGFAEMCFIRSGNETVTEDQRCMIFVSFVEFEHLE